jgi:DNA-binding CsgD family transcriptional regulator
MAGGPTRAILHPHMPEALQALPQTDLSPVARFSVDAEDCIVSWNQECERLLEISAADAIGRKCYEVFNARDVYGNIYCHRGCPIAYQTRGLGEAEAHDIPVTWADRSGASRRLWLSTSVIPGETTALAVIVHTLREPEPEVEQGGVALDAATTPPSLTPREKQILALLSEGLRTDTISQRLAISAVTVRNHVARILAKLGVHTKLEAVVLASRCGLVPPPGSAAAGSRFGRVAAPRDTGGQPE